MFEFSGMGAKVLLLVMSAINPVDANEQQVPPPPIFNVYEAETPAVAVDDVGDAQVQSFHTQNRPEANKL